MRIEHRLPTVTEFMELRAQTDWGVPEKQTVEATLNRSFSGAVVVEDGQTIAMTRTVGDGCLIIYIQDVVIASSHRRQGVGRLLLEALLEQLSKTCLADCTVGLFAAVGQTGFYENLGFNIRGNAAYGPGMHGTLSDLAKRETAA